MSLRLERLLRVSLFPHYASMLWCRWRVRRQLRRLRAEVGEGLVCYGMPLITAVRPGGIRLGSRVQLASTSASTALGVARPVILRTMTPDARIEIGDDVGLSGTTVCAARAVRIGHRCLIGADVLISDTDFHPLAPEGRHLAPIASAASAAVELGDDVFIGARSIILKGVRIGRGAVVGAGSVVTRSLPAGCVAAGNPAVVLRRSPDGDRAP